MTPEEWLNYSKSQFTINGTVYRNLEAQVQKNKDDIANLDLETLSGLPDRMDAAEEDIETLDTRSEEMGDDIQDLTADKQDKPTKLTVTLTAIGWSNHQQVLTVQGVTASNLVIVSPAASAFIAYGDSQVRATAQTTNQLIFTCEDDPTDNLNVEVTIWG